MYAWGYDLEMVNGAVGSLSMLNDVANWAQTRQNNWSLYCQRRNPSGLPGDRGDSGSYIIVGTRIFNCTTGNSRSMVNQGQILNDAGKVNQNEVVTTGVLTSAGSAPAGLSAANVGDTVVDGGIVWTCLATTLSPNFSGMLGTANVMTTSQFGYGYDTLGAAQRLHENMQAVRGVDRRIIYIQNAQGDLGVGATTYGNALIAISDFFLLRGYDVMFGLSCWSPSAASASTTNYDDLATGRATAKATQAAAYPGKVYDGANLYALMGTTGPMASGGAFLQGDNVHLNGAGAVGPDVSGVSSAYKHVSDALKAVLPQLVS